MREGSVHALAAFGAGVLLALYGSLIVGSGQESPDAVLPAPGPVACWAVDRDAQELCGLDADLLIARKVRVDWPLALCSRRDAGAWVLRSTVGTAAAPCRLDLWRSDGSIAVQIDLGPCRALSTIDGRDALVIEKGTGTSGADRLLRCEDDGRKRALIELSDLTCVADTGGSLVAGTGRGELLEWGSCAEDRMTVRTVLDGAIVDLAPGPRRGSAWVLFGEGGARVGMLEPGLALQWAAPTRATGGRCTRLGPVRGEERVWIADIDGHAVQRFGPGGVLELEISELPIAGSIEVVAWKYGKVLLVSAGAILQLDQRGRMLRGQGGFAYLTDLEVVGDIER